mmetsp:Transcript_27492/g.64442  ORF Transcript_27492/g.64442 Transcript_27492/m.64442 type:complete len:117 (+) Transcript_27492:969-1319(+)
MAWNAPPLLSWMAPMAPDSFFFFSQQEPPPIHTSLAFNIASTPPNSSYISKVAWIAAASSNNNSNDNKQQLFKSTTLWTIAWIASCPWTFVVVRVLLCHRHFACFVWSSTPIPFDK